MFIKQAYENRLKREEQQENEGIFQKKPQINKIGSIRNKKINYHNEEQFFSVDDIPQKAKEVKKQVQEFIDPDLLGLRNKQWNSSTSVPLNPLQEETHERKLIKIKLGLFDQPQPVQKEKFIEPGTDTRDDYTGWNVSNQVLQKELDHNLMAQTHHALNKNKEKEEYLLEGYVTPVESIRIQNDKFRMLKQIEKPERDSIRDQYQYQNPAASKEKVDGAVFRLTYEKQLQQKQMIQDPALTFKPDTSISKKSRDQITKYIEAQHTGIYELSSKFEKDDDGNPVQVGYWSCCLNEDQNAPGCSKTVKDKGRWNFASYNQD